MKKNIGSVDRLIRLLVAIVLLSLYTGGILSGVWGIAGLLLSGVFIITSMVSSCPLYLPFGIRTNRKKVKY